MIWAEEEFGFVLDDNGFGGWHNGGTMEQVAMRPTCHRCHRLSVIRLRTIHSLLLFS